MAYNTKPIVTDKDGNPISQYYNSTIDQYEPVEGAGGGNKVVLYNEDGTENNSLSLQPILDKLSQLTGTVIDEETRKANEITREDNEVNRIALYNDLLVQLDRISKITEQVPQSVLDSVDTLRDTIGDLQNLDTAERSNIVLALNEVYRKLGEHKAENATDNVHGIPDISEDVIAENIVLRGIGGGIKIPRMGTPGVKASDDFARPTPFVFNEYTTHSADSELEINVPSELGQFSARHILMLVSVNIAASNTVRRNALYAIGATNATNLNYEVKVIIDSPEISIVYDQSINKLRITNTSGNPRAIIANAILI